MDIADRGIEQTIINNGIKNLKEFGYPEVTQENIFTDIIYAGFFKSMLKDNLGGKFDKIINGLLLKIEQAKRSA